MKMKISRSKECDKKKCIRKMSPIEGSERKVRQEAEWENGRKEK